MKFIKYTRTIWVLGDSVTWVFCDGLALSSSVESDGDESAKNKYSFSILKLFRNMDFNNENDVLNWMHKGHICKKKINNYLM
jgi:hypothetical protein